MAILKAPTIDNTDFEDMHYNYQVKKAPRFTGHGICQSIPESSNWRTRHNQKKKKVTVRNVDSLWTFVGAKQ